MSAQGTDERVVDLAQLRVCMEQALAADGMSAAHAAETAEVLIDAEMRGYDDHGVWFFGEVHKWLKSKALNPAPNIRVIREIRSAGAADRPGCHPRSAFDADRLWVWTRRRRVNRPPAVPGQQCPRQRACLLSHAASAFRSSSRVAVTFAPIPESFFKSSE